VADDRASASSVAALRMEMNAGAPGIFSRRSQQDRLWNEVFSLSFLGNLSDFINSARKDRKFRLFFSKVTS
jgi:hypothetical protein